MVIMNEREIFLEALEMAAPEARAAYLQAACGQDVALRRRVEELLKEHFSNDTLLAGPALEGPGPAATVPFTDAAPAQMIGRYKLLEVIGEGGFGEVWMAEQREPVKRRVALKIIKLGMDTRAVVARFEAERQALAIMDHPNIAKVLDGGATNTGRPYFVMELVKGVALTKYCDDHGLDTEARLRIFMDVCAAVQHAHQKGIIHRDLKPSNILVAVDGAKVIPKVIDFGIAKATQQELTDKTLYTQFQQFLGTPAYMSPEQAGLSGLDIDTRSDIYSLGVLLYELLTGRPPFDPTTLFKAGVEEIRRIIREQEPQRPSTRLSTLSADELTTLGRNRKADPRKLAIILRGDLDWVVMKALEKDRNRRYATANGLAADLDRYLKQEPVSAVAPSFSYKAGKFIRRNRRGVAMAAAIAGLLVAGIAATTWLAVVATRARDVAARESLRSFEVAQFLKAMLEGVGPARARGRDTTMLREILDTAAQRVGTRLTNQPDVQFELSSIIGRTYMAAGSAAEAERLDRAALGLAQRLYGPEHTNLVATLEELGGLLNDVGRQSEATNVLRQALAMSRNLVGDDHPLTAGCMRRLGIIEADLGHYAEAERLLIPAVSTLTRHLAPGDPRTLWARHNLASLYFREQRLDEMETVAVSNLADARRVLGNDDPLTLAVASTVALLRQYQGRFAEAEALHAEVLAAKRRILGETHPNTLLNMDYLAVVYGFQGRFAEAEALSRAALDVYTRAGDTRSRGALSLGNNHAEYLRNLGRHAEAEAEFRRILEVDAQTTTESDPFFLETRNSFALLHQLQGRPAEAEAQLRDMVRIRRAELAADDPDLADTLAHLARVLLATGRPAEAEPLARESMAVFDARLPDDWRRYAVWSLVGGCRLASGDPASAEKLVRSGYDGLKVRESRIPAIDQFRLREALERLVALNEALHRPEEAAQWRQQLAEFNQSPAGKRLQAALGGARAP
jgi:serine/threonine protein kinase